MTDQPYHNREIDSMFKNILDKMEEQKNDFFQKVKEMMENDTGAHKQVFDKLIIMEKTINRIEIQEAERRGSLKWAVRIGLFIATVMVAFLGWVSNTLLSLRGQVDSLEARVSDTPTKQDLQAQVQQSVEDVITHSEPVK